MSERAVAPYLRADLRSLHQDLLALNHRMVEMEKTMHIVRAATDALEVNQPLVLNAINSTNGTARILRRQLAALERELHDQRPLELETLKREVAAGELRILGEVSPHAETLSWLLRRVELIRAEMLNEMHYGGRMAADAPPSRIVNPAALEPSDGELRVNLGAGHLPLDGYINVDMRELPGIDVVAPVDRLPFPAASLTEITSAHTLEHFPLEDLSRRLLPYWFTMLRPGGTFRAVVPDMEAMAKAFAEDQIDFDALRAVTYGGQEYTGDFHFTGFSPASLSAVVERAGFHEVEVVAAGRPNGDCLECEVVARRPDDA